MYHSWLARRSVCSPGNVSYFFWLPEHICAVALENLSLEKAFTMLSRQIPPLVTYQAGKLPEVTSIPRVKSTHWSVQAADNPCSRAADALSIFSCSSKAAPGLWDPT